MYYRYIPRFIIEPIYFKGKRMLWMYYRYTPRFIIEPIYFEEKECYECIIDTFHDLL